MSHNYTNRWITLYITLYNNYANSMCFIIFSHTGKNEIYVVGIIFSLSTPANSAKTTQKQHFVFFA